MLSDLDGHVVLCGGGEEMVVLGQPDQVTLLRNFAEA
jgi:hypothetical protein